MCYNYNETKKQKRSFLVSHHNNTVFLLFTGADVTDHIPVDDNPVYITMKKIDLRKKEHSL